MTDLSARNVIDSVARRNMWIKEFVHRVPGRWFEIGCNTCYWLITVEGDGLDDAVEEHIRDRHHPELLTVLAGGYGLSPEESTS